MKWQLIVKLNNIDISNRIVSNVSIEAEEDTARICEFSIASHSLGAMSLSSFVGTSVTIDYVQVEPALTPVRVFTGVVDTPEYDIKTKITRFRCTDDMQRKATAYMNKSTGKFWNSSPTNTATYIDELFGVYDKKTGYDQLLTARETLLYSIDLDANGNFQACSFEPKTVPDYTYTENEIVQDSLSVQFAPRNQIKNKIDIAVDYRYDRLHEIRGEWTWSHPGLCHSLQYGTSFPTVAMVEQAATSTGWKVAAFDHTSPPPSQTITCAGSTSAWVINEEVRQNLCYTVDIVLKKRFAQKVTDKYALTVTSSASVDRLGELINKDSSSFEVEGFNLDEWLNNYDYPPFASINGAETIKDNKDLEPSISKVNTAIKALIAKAKREIVNSHRQNYLSFSIPINPSIERTATVLVDTAEVAGKGKVKHIVHNFDTQSGTAKTEIKVAISRIDAVGIQPPDSPLVAPDTPTTPTGSTGISTTLTNHIANIDGAPTDSQDGYVGNDTTGGNPHEFRINVPEITTAQQEEVTHNITETYDVSIRDDYLELSA